MGAGHGLGLDLRQRPVSRIVLCWLGDTWMSRAAGTTSGPVTQAGSGGEDVASAVRVAGSAAPLTGRAWSCW